jgi:type IV pilus assembly protein PilY1
VAIGANDGSMRLIRNSLATGTDTQDGAGKEAWAFVPQATMGGIKTLYNNSSANKHPYLVDGAPASLTIDKDGDGTIEKALGDRVYLYFGLRRGGRTFYALDITDPTTPKILWRIDNTMADYTALGYSFAQPRIGNVNLDLDGDGKKSDPVVFIAGGYSLNKDTRDAVGTDDTYGNAFYVVDAKTGALVWKAVKAGSDAPISTTAYGHSNLTDSIPADPAVLDTDGDGLVDRVVVGDTGGQVWRFDTHSDRSNWRASRIGNFGRHYTSAMTNDLRFGHRPDVVPSRDKFGKFDAVVIGSGDRENPLDRSGDSLDADTPVNWMFMIKDRQWQTVTSATGALTTVDPSDLADVSSATCITDATCGGALNTASLDKTVNSFYSGWKLELGVGPGEKSLSAPLTIVNTVFFTTYLPFGTSENVSGESGDAATCGPSEGKGAFYAVNLGDATLSTNFNIARDGQDASTNTSRYTELSSAGIPADVVGVSLDGQAYVLPPDLKLGKVESSTRWRTFWYEVDTGDD